MNKQEAIEKLKSKAKPHWLDEEIYGDSCIKSVELCMAIEIVNQIDEPEKPVVPQFVAEWYEKNKDDLEYNLYKLCTDFREQKLREDFHGWFNDDNNKSIETLVLMHKFGYEVEKEKLYTVEMPNPNSDDHLVLRKNIKGKVCVSLLHREYWRGYESTQLTEAEIKQDFDWAWQFAKEVKE